MKIKVLSILMIFLTLTSCKKEDAKKVNEETKNKVTDDFFRVSFNLTVAKDDNMHLYYTVDGSINFEEEKSVWMPVKGSNEPQNIVFTLPEGVIPSLVRVDFGFGKNEDQSDIDLKGFTLSYMGKEEVVRGTEILKYFTPFEPYTDIPAGTTILKRQTKTQDSGPILYPQEALAEKINSVTAGQSPE